MRASEQVAEGRIRGIKESDERIKGGLRTFGKLASTAVGATTLASGAALSAKIAPFLSEYITPELALKGISKVSPKFGDALRRGMKDGLSLESGLDFLKESIKKPKEQENAQQSGNVIEQYSPELHEFISSEIEKGRSPIEAGAAAELNGKFKNAIGKLTKDHKSPFSALLQTVYGSDKKQEALGKFKQHQKKSGMVDELYDMYQQGQQQNQMGQPQQGENSQIVKAAFDKIMQM